MSKILLPLSLAMIWFNLHAQAPTYTLTIEIVNVKNEKGNLFLALFNSAESFEKDQRFKSKVQKAEAGKVVAIWQGLPAGNYAFKIFHDENDNKAIDTNFFGIPSEAYAFSNNAKASFGPPDYEDAQFTLDQNIVQTIKLKY